MNSLPTQPELQYPNLEGLPSVGPEELKAWKVSYDNLFYLRRLVDSQGTSAPLTDPQIQQVLESIKSTSSTTINPQSSAILVGTHLNRLTTYPATGQAVGTMFWEYDRTLLYVVTDAFGPKQWRYVSGIYKTSQSALPNDFSSGDVGAQVEVTDYAHILEWTGAAFRFFGNDTSGYIQMWPAAPDPLTGWQLCNGTATHRLAKDGTLVSVTVPNYTTPAYAKLGITASIGPNSPSGQTSDDSAGTPAGSVAATFTGDTNGTTVDLGPGVDVQAGTGTIVAAHTHVHDVVPSGSIAATFTGTPLGTHHHGPDTLELENTQLLAYYRL